MERRPPRQLPETVNVNIANPGIEGLRTELSGLAFALGAFYRTINQRLDLILEAIGNNDPEAVAKIRAAAAKLKTDTDKLEGAVREHSPKGQE